MASGKSGRQGGPGPTSLSWAPLQLLVFFSSGWVGRGSLEQQESLQGEEGRPGLLVRVQEQRLPPSEGAVPVETGRKQGRRDGELLS